MRTRRDKTHRITNNIDKRGKLKQIERTRCCFDKLTLSHPLIWTFSITNTHRHNMRKANDDIPTFLPYSSPFESKKTATVNTAFVIPLDKANKQLYNYDNKQNKTKLKPM